MISINNDRQLKQSLSFLTASIFTFAIIFCLSLIKNELDLTTIAANYNLNISDFVAEKSERYQYIFGTIAFPVFFILAKIFFNKKLFKNPQKLENLVSWSAFSIIVLLAMIIIYKTPKIIPLFLYISSSDVNITIQMIASVLFILFIVFSLIFLLIYYSMFANMNTIDNRYFKKKFVDIVIYVAAAINLIFIFFLYVTKTYYFNFNFVGRHFDAYFYPVYKVFCGQTPLIDFNCLYGFYPYFLVPLLKITGGISMLRFSVAMASLLVVSLLAITIVIFGCCKNKVLALIGTLSVSFVIAVCPMLYRGELYYLQYVPHRVLFPSLILLTCFILVKQKNNKARIAVTLVGYVLSSISLLWNIDTGAVVLLSFSMFQIYLLLLKNGFKERKLYGGSIIIILLSILSLTASLLTLISITYARSGEMLSISSIFYSQTSFYSLGFYMLRMPFLSTWLLFIIMYAVFLAKALSKVKFLRNAQDDQDEKDVVKNALHFILPVIGMGIFSYYQGRSHFLVFLAVMWPGIILLIFMMDEYLGKIVTQSKDVKHGIDLNKLKLIFTFILLASIAGNYLVHAAMPFELQAAKDKVHAVKTSEISSLLDLVKTVEKNGEQIDLVTLNSAAVYCILDETKIADIPATIDWFKKDDYQKVFNYLLKTNNKIIIDEYSMNLMKKYELDKLQNVLTHFVLLEQPKGFWIYSPVK